MNKVVFNARFGGFSLSEKAIQWLSKNAREEIKPFVNRLADNISRHDPDLIKCVETLKEQANGEFANLKIQEIKGNKYRIDEYDGLESVYEPEDLNWIIID